MAQIFLVEDEERVAAFIKKGLEEDDNTVDLARDGAEAIKQFQNKPYDLIILDIMLPFVNGNEVCRHIRQKNATVPILMLTALGTIDNKVTGFKAGADDYLLKPFHFQELLVRIEALLRRNTLGERHMLLFEDIKLDTQSDIVIRSGKKIPLTSKEFALFAFLMKNPNKILSRSQISESVWGIQFDTGTNVVDVYINYLRNKIDKGFELKYIHTVIGKGYILKAGN